MIPWLCSGRYASRLPRFHKHTIRVLTTSTAPSRRFYRAIGLVHWPTSEVRGCQLSEPSVQQTNSLVEPEQTTTQPKAFVQHTVSASHLRCDAHPVGGLTAPRSPHGFVIIRARAYMTWPPSAGQRRPNMSESHQPKLSASSLPEPMTRQAPHGSGRPSKPPSCTILLSSPFRCAFPPIM